MKGFSKLKLVQLGLFILCAITGLVIVLGDSELFQMIGFDAHIRSLCILLWLAVGMAFVFLFLDFRLDSRLRRENEELNYAFYTDPDTGISNRNSCDAFIDQYRDRVLPEGMAALTFMVTNLKEINEDAGYAAGDAALRDFAEILQQALPKGDFLGRNGGDRFLMILKRCTAADKDTLLQGIAQAAAKRNEAHPGQEMTYRAGAALQAERRAKTMHTLVAVSDRRARGEEQ